MGQCRGNAEGHREQQQAHRIVNGHHQHQQTGQGAIGFILPHHHQGSRRCRGRSNGTQGNGAGKGDHLGEYQVLADQHQIHQNRSQHSLADADGNGGATHSFQLLEPELIADGEGNKAQRRLGKDVHALHLLQRIEAQAGDLQSTQNKGTQQQACHQIGSYCRQMQQLGNAGKHQASHQCCCHTNQKRFHRINILLSKNSWSEGVVSEEAASLDQLKRSVF